MGGYIMNFAVYTMAMAGLICLALFVYKKVMDGCCFDKKSNFLEIEDRMSLAPRKTIYVIRAGNEKFLVASDIDKTSLISKLNENPEKSAAEINSGVDDLPVIGLAQRDTKKTVIKDMLRKMNS